MYVNFKINYFILKKVKKGHHVMIHKFFINNLKYIYIFSPSAWGVFNK